MKGAEGEGVKISEREKGGVSGIPCSPRHGLGLGFSGPLPFLEAVTQDAQELDSQASLWQRSVYILDAEPSFREEGLTFPAPSKPLHCPCSKRTSPWPFGGKNSRPSYREGLEMDLFFSTYSQ